jgi:hypothetical protein
MRRTSWKARSSRARPGLSELVDELMAEAVDLPGGEEGSGVIGDWLGRNFVQQLTDTARREMWGRFGEEETEDLASVMVRVFASGYVTARRGLSVGGADDNGTG